MTLEKIFETLQTLLKCSLNRCSWTYSYMFTMVSRNSYTKVYIFGNIVLFLFAFHFVHTNFSNNFHSNTIIYMLKLYKSTPPSQIYLAHPKLKTWLWLCMCSVYFISCLDVCCIWGCTLIIWACMHVILATPLYIIYTWAVMTFIYVDMNYCHKYSDASEVETISVVL